jgi:hypothetical protein
MAMLHNGEQNPEECPDAAHKPYSGSVTMQPGVITVMHLGSKKQTN